MYCGMREDSKAKMNALRKFRHWDFWKERQCGISSELFFYLFIWSGGCAHGYFISAGNRPGSHACRWFLVFIVLVIDMMLGSKGILPPMIHGLLRISCSRNPKAPQIRSFFYEKWLLFGVLRVNKSWFFMQARNAWPFDPCIKSFK